MDSEKVIKGLECYLAMRRGEKILCGMEHCPYWEEDDDTGMSLCNNYQIESDALALLKAQEPRAQEPRAMTLGEVQKIASIRDGAIWLEAGAGLMPAFMEFATKDITFFVAVPLTGYRQFFENDWYGKTWRCWTSRPTDEQREAVKWE